MSVATLRSTRSWDQVITFAQLFEEARNLLEVITAVGIAHDDEAAAGGGDAAHQGAAITARRNIDYSRTESRRDVERTVGAAVVGDDNFPRDVVFANRPLRFLDASVSASFRQGMTTLSSSSSGRWSRATGRASVSAP